MGLPLPDIYNQKLLSFFIIVSMLAISRISRRGSFSFIPLSFSNKPSANYFRQRSIPSRICYSFSSHSILQDLNQIKQGQKFYEQLNIAGAQEMLERSLNIVPFFMADNAQYNHEFQNILDLLIRAYAWKGDLSKIEQLLIKIQEAKTTKNIQNFQKINKAIQVMALLGRSDFQLPPEKKGIRQLYVEAKTISSDSNYQLEAELTLNDKNKQPNTDNIQSWIHGELKDTWTFVVLNLLSRKNIYSNQQYNKLCSTLLKNSQRSSQKNVVKPLILLISNLLRNEQYLQAEGMLSYCLDRKKDNLKPQLLKYNQEYIVLNLLLAKTFRGVKREAESIKLLQQNRNRFNLDSLVLQGYLLDSI